jgi:hypothetical protein
VSPLRRRDALLLAAGAPLAGAVSARAADVSLATLLARAHRLELASAVLYESAGALGALATAFAAHERDQAAAVLQALEAVGGRPLAEPAGPADVDALVPGLPAAGGARALAAYAVEFEEAALAAHNALLGATDDPSLLRTLASIMAAAGAHLAALRARAGLPPVATL